VVDTIVDRVEPAGHLRYLATAVPVEMMRDPDTTSDYKHADDGADAAAEYNSYHIHVPALLTTRRWRQRLLSSIFPRTLLVLPRLAHRSPEGHTFAKPPEPLVRSAKTQEDKLGEVADGLGLWSLVS
jgi:hypothetical protein